MPEAGHQHRRELTARGSRRADGRRWLPCSRMTSPRSTRRRVERRRRRMAVAVGRVRRRRALVAVVAAGIALFGGTTTTAARPPPARRRPPRRLPPRPRRRPRRARDHHGTAGGARGGERARDRARLRGRHPHADLRRPARARTSPNGTFGGAPTRTLPDRVLVPGRRCERRGADRDARPTRHGPYPLVLFAHGYDVTPDFYAPAARAVGGGRATSWRRRRTRS